MSNEPCCAHSIVSRTSVRSADFPGASFDAWACCDCGARFSRDLTLPTFQPEPSHLHTKLDALRARVAALEAAVARYRDYEYVEAQHEETGRSWFGARYNIPTRFHEVSNESGEPGPTARDADNKEGTPNAKL